MKFFKKLFAPREVKIALGVLDELDYEGNTHGYHLPSFVREPIELTILKYPEKFVSELKSQGRTPRQKVYSMIEHVAGDHLQCGSFNYCFCMGKLTPAGEQVLKIYDYIIDRVKEEGCVSEEEAQKQKSDIRNCIKNVWGDLGIS